MSELLVLKANNNKVNDLLKHKKLKLSVIGIKLVFNSTWYLKMFNLNQ